MQRRHGIKRPKGKQSRGTTTMMTLVLCAAAFFCLTSFAGGWLADNVVRPVFSSFGIWGETTPAPSASSTVKPSPNVAVETSAYTAYFLQTGVFAKEENAQNESANWQAQGGAGYIAVDGDRYRVMMAAYQSESDAASVRDRLKEDGVETRVHVVSASAKTVMVQTDAQAQILKTVLDGWQNNLKQLFSANAETAGTVNDQLSTLLSKLEENFESGSDAFADELYEIIKDCKQELTTALATSDSVRAQALLQHACAKGNYRYLVLLAKS